MSLHSEDYSNVTSAIHASNLAFDEQMKRIREHVSSLVDTVGKVVRVNRERTQAVVITDRKTSRGYEFHYADEVDLLTNEVSASTESSEGGDTPRKYRFWNHCI